MTLKIATVAETDGSDEPSSEMLHERVSAVLKKELMRGRLEPGQKLPLRALAHSLGTSLIPVRDALQRLESMGCVVSSTNRIMAVPVYTAKELCDIRDLRMMLEGEAAAAAAINRSQDELKAMRRACDDICRAGKTGDLDLFLDANYQLHMSIAQASRIAFITTLLEPLWIRIGPTIRQSKPGPKHISKAVQLHNEIYEAILHNDSEAARDAIRRDIRECNQYRTGDR